MYGFQVFDMMRVIFESVNQLGIRVMHQFFKLICLPEIEISRALRRNETGCTSLFRTCAMMNCDEFYNKRKDLCTRQLLNNN